MINIYVGNLPYKTSEADLAELFAPFGQVERASIVMDRQTGRSRGFGFVEMTDHAEGTKAIDALAGEAWNGRPLTINEARPRGSGTTGGDSGFSSATTNVQSDSDSDGARPAKPASNTAYGNSRGYSNQLHAPSDPPEVPSQAGPEANPENASGPPPADPEDKPKQPPTSGYANHLLD